MAFYLCGLLLKDTQPQSISKINIKHIPSKGYSTKHLNSIPQTCQSHERTRKVWEPIIVYRRHDNTM